MPEKLIIQPNRPIYVCLEDPAGDWNGLEGTYRTTAGQILVLPRQAVVALNIADPKPGEEVRIIKHWQGKPGDHIKWTVALTGRGERAPASESAEPASIAAELEQPASPPEPAQKPISAPISISRHKSPPAQPRLFDSRGTGTYGPVRAAATDQGPRPIPANVAMKEILQFIAADPNTVNWSDQARERLASSIYTAMAGHIGLWERGK